MSSLLKFADALVSLRSAPWRVVFRCLLPFKPAPVGDEPAIGLPILAPDWRDALVEVGLPEVPPAGGTHVPVLGAVPWGLPVSWSRDEASGFDFGDGPSRRVRPRPELPDVDLLRVWMRGRHVDALHMAWRAALHGEAESAKLAGEICEDFLARNPAGHGPHWRSAMEAGLRGIRLLHVAAWLTEAAGRLPEAEAALDVVAESLRVHECWLSRHSEWFFHFTGNHYLVALAGRYLLAEHLPSSPARRRMARRTWSRFWHEFRRQVGDDGIGFESATSYHLLVLQTAVHVMASGERAGRTMPRKARSRMQAAGLATAALARPDGSVARVGDGDDGCFVESAEVAPSPCEDVRPLLAQLAAACGSALAPTPRTRAEDWAVAQLLGAAGRDRFLAAAERPLAPACHPDGGLAVLVEGDVHVTVAAAGPGRTGTGGHWHDDAGSVSVWHGAPLIVDRGTGSYTGDVEMRERYRSVRSHSVLQVDELDQNARVEGSVFRGRPRAWPRLTEFSHEDGGAVGVGHHGYFVAPARVGLHRRLRLAGGRLSVEDRVTGSGERTLSSRLQWAPGVTPAPASDGGFTVHREGLPDLVVQVIASDVKGVSIPFEIEHREVLHSPAMGREVPALTTEIRLAPQLPVVLTWTLEVDPAGEAAGNSA